MIGHMENIVRLARGALPYEYSNGRDPTYHAWLFGHE